MPTHIALLRGINVGRSDKNKVLMVDLRRLVTGLGHADVATYIQSGNVIFTAAAGETDQPGSDELAREIEAAIAAELGVQAAVIARAKTDLAAVVAANPYPDEPIPKYVHAVFLPADPAPAAAAQISAAVADAAAAGSRDEASLIGRTLYIHTPDGFGWSGLAAALLTKRSSPVAAGTARNWSTVTKLLAMCEGAPT